MASVYFSKKKKKKVIEHTALKIAYQLHLFSLFTKLGNKKYASNLES